MIQKNKAVFNAPAVLRFYRQSKTCTQAFVRTSRELSPLDEYDNTTRLKHGDYHLTWHDTKFTEV